MRTRTRRWTGAPTAPNMRRNCRFIPCWSVAKYRDHVARIVHELGRRYGRDARVWGWQLDNELTHYGKEPCHCGACQA